MQINPEKGKSKKETTNSENNNSPALNQMISSVRGICDTISDPKFKVNKGINAIKEYVKEYDRLLYSEVSTYCYSLDEQKLHAFQGNLYLLVDYVLKDSYEKRIEASRKKDDNEQYELLTKTKRIVVKLYDNVNLAHSQLMSLRKSDDDLNTAIFDVIAPIRDTIVKETTELASKEVSKEANTQLISLVGIFTAIAFLVFGGFDSLMSIFSNIAVQPISKIIMLLSMWGLVICNGLFVLLSCIERITQKRNLTNLTITSTISQWANLILITIFLSSALIYTIIIKNLHQWLIQLLQSNVANIVFCIVGFFVIIALFITGACLIIKKSKKQF